MLIDDIEYVIFRHPDPEGARQFMLDNTHSAATPCCSGGRHFLGYDW
jgi:hypothetical protein